MKESVGEGSMTIITIIIVAGTLAGITYIIFNLLNNQQSRTNCENAGYEYHNGACYDGASVITTY